MRYLVSAGNFLEIQFSSKIDALNYAKKIFEEGEETAFNGRFWPQNEGYKNPKELVCEIPEYLGEEEED